MKKILLLIFLFALVFSCYKVEADQFINEFYEHVNIIRESKNLVALKPYRNIEQVAESYSGVIAENGRIDHNALTEFEFSALCTNFDVPVATLLEILASCPDDYLPYQVFLLFLLSEPHKAALLDPRGRFIGAGYTTKNGYKFFTAYIMIGEK